MTDTTTIIDQYNAAFLERVPEKLVDLIADDCVELVHQPIVVPRWRASPVANTLATPAPS